MTDIIKHEQNGLTAPGNQTEVLPILAQEVFEALSSPLVKDSFLPDIFSTVQSAITKSFADTGFKLPDGLIEIGTIKMFESQYLVNELIKHIKTYHPSIRVNEIWLALNRGVCKQYGDYMGLSVNSFRGFIDGYVKDENQSRKKALMEKNAVKEEKPAPTAAEQFELFKSLAISALKDVELGRDISLKGATIYDFIFKLGLFDFTIDDNTAFFQQAQQELIEEYTEKSAIELDKFKRGVNKAILESIITGSDRELARVYNRAKAVTLKTYLEGVLFDDVDFAELLESRKDNFLC